MYRIEKLCAVCRSAIDASPAPLPPSATTSMDSSTVVAHAAERQKRAHSNCLAARTWEPQWGHGGWNSRARSNHQLISQICFLSDTKKSKHVFSSDHFPKIPPNPCILDNKKLTFLRVPDHSCHAARGEEPRCSREAPNKAHVRVQLWAHSEPTLTWWPPQKMYLIDHNSMNSI